MEMKKKYNETPTLKWSVVKSLPAYSDISKNAFYVFTKSLKFSIFSFKDQTHLLSKRSEIISKRRHAKKYHKSNDQLERKISFSQEIARNQVNLM